MYAAPQLFRLHHYNPSRTTLYVGVTKDPTVRLVQHIEATQEKITFAGKFNCVNLVYYEHFENISDAISREKEIKKWRREKKERLIRSFNPEWRILNAEIADR